jgi:hypothetical protein
MRMFGAVVRHDSRLQRHMLEAFETGVDHRLHRNRGGSKCPRNRGNSNVGSRLLCVGLRNSDGAATDAHTQRGGGHAQVSTCMARDLVRRVQCRSRRYALALTLTVVPGLVDAGILRRRLYGAERSVLEGWPRSEKTTFVTVAISERLPFKRLMPWATSPKPSATSGSSTRPGPFLRSNSERPHLLKVPPAPGVRRIALRLDGGRHQLLDRSRQ